ncbi:hypothetical protein CBS9595_002188 [Malassezia furfur]|nr:hypothetical protein CBS9595_002188 [Malassezia furfur]
MSGADGPIPSQRPREASDTKLPEFVLTPPEPFEHFPLEGSALAPDSPGSSQLYNASPVSRRFAHRRGSSHASIPEKAAPPPPPIPVSTDLREAEGAINKINRMQRAQAPKHVWHKWSGLAAAREASNRMNAPRGTNAEDDEEQRLLTQMDADCTAQGLPGAPDGTGAPCAPEQSLGSRTPSLSLSATPPPHSGSPSPAQTPSSMMPNLNGLRRPSQLDLCAQPELQQPRATYIPRELLSEHWDQSSSNSGSEDDDAGGTWSTDTESSESESQSGQIPARLNLSHAEVMTNKQMRRRLRAMRKMRYRQTGPNGEQSESSNSFNPHSLRQSVAHGLKYASKMQRTQRAMERYTPASQGESSETEERLLPPDAVPESLVPSRQSSPGVSDAPSGSMCAPETKLPHVWRRRQRRAWNNAPSAMDMAQLEEEENCGRMCPDVTRVQDTKPMVQGDTSKAQLFPKGYKTELVYDMLHENQRGIVWFGVAKQFSSQMLLFWDPSPWTDASGANTALDTSTMQLPDPTWEWVHPSWLVDMTCDTDEEGWQYSGSFTGLQMWKRPIHFSNSRGLNQWLHKLYLFAQRREEKSNERREQREAHAPRGLSAMMRSARLRTLRWHGRPTMWTFVRRRRWVRLRRRLVPITDSNGRSSEHIPAQIELIPLSDTESLDAADEEERPDNDVRTETDAQTNTEGRECALDAKDPVAPPVHIDTDDERAVQELRHMHQVYKTKHILHMLAPFFLLSSQQVQEILRNTDEVPVYKSEAWRHQVAMIMDQELRVQNPFITYPAVCKWLEREDLAELTAPLHAHEANYRNLCNARVSSSCILPGAPQRDEAFDTLLPPRVDPAVALCATGEPSLVREAVVERNFTMAIDTMKLCRVDRLKLDLWLVWLGVRSTRDLVAGGEREMGGPIAAIQHEWNRRAQRVHAYVQAPSVFSGAVERCLRARIHEHTVRTPHLLDVWDVLVAHLHEIVAMLDHERSRRTFLHLAHKLQSTDYSLPTAAPSLDPRWRVRRPGVGRLPRLPALGRV